MFINNWLNSLNTHRTWRGKRRRRRTSPTSTAAETLEERTMLSAILIAVDMTKSEAAETAQSSLVDQSDQMNPRVAGVPEQLEQLAAIVAAVDSLHGFPIDRIDLPEHGSGIKTDVKPPSIEDAQRPEDSDATEESSTDKANQLEDSIGIDAARKLAADLFAALDAVGMSQLATQFGITQNSAESTARWLESWRSPRNDSMGRSTVLESGEKIYQDSRTRSDSESSETEISTSTSTSTTTTSTSTSADNSERQPFKSSGRGVSARIHHHKPSPQGESHFMKTARELIRNLDRQDNQNSTNQVSRPVKTKERPTDDGPVDTSNAPMIEEPIARRTHGMNTVADPTGPDDAVDRDVARLVSSLIAGLQSVVNPGPDGWEAPKIVTPNGPPDPGVVDPPDRVWSKNSTERVSPLFFTENRRPRPIGRSRSTVWFWAESRLKWRKLAQKTPECRYAVKSCLSPAGANPARPMDRSAGSNQSGEGGNKFVEVLCVKVTSGDRANAQAET